MFTDLEVSKIESMKNMNINDLKEKLALEATKMLHGQKEADKAFKTSTTITSRVTFIPPFKSRPRFNSLCLQSA